MKRLPYAWPVLILLALLVAFTSGSSPGPEARAQVAQPNAVKVEVKDHTTSSSYANFCRVTGTPEEVILEFGLNPQPFGNPPGGVQIDDRIVLNFYNAKRLLNALQVTVQRHEDAFGELELDAQKRVQKKL